MNDFNSWAKWYDIIYSERIKELPEISFYENLLNKENVNKSLEVACGTGRLYIPLINKGHDIDGLDISEKMIEELKEKADNQNLNPTIYHGDIAEIDLNNSYDLIYFPFTAITHLSDLKQQIKAMNNIYSHLNDEGIFALDTTDVSFKNLLEHGKMKEETKRIDDVEYKLEFWQSDYKGPLDSVKFNNRIINTDTDDIVFETSFKLALIPKNQLELLLINAGFSEYSIKHTDNNRFRIIAQK